MAAGDEFDDLYHALFPRLAAELFAYLGDRAEAEDVTQEALLRAWQRWSTVGHYDEPMAWVRHVAWNLATSRWRRMTAAGRAWARHRSPAYAAVTLSADHVALVAALRRLPERPRRAIVLHYIADLSVAQVASDMATRPGTVMSWLHRGRAELARLLSDDQHDPLEATSRG